jgi:hypothetical protein
MVGSDGKLVLQTSPDCPIVEHRKLEVDPDRGTAGAVS